MKTASVVIYLFSLLLFISCNKVPENKNQAVNSLIGDISYELKYGQKPTSTTNNELRIKTHLEYVENLLRSKEVSNLPSDLKIKRTHLLDLLHNYWVKGIFPKNYDYTEQRKPCFIDKDGTICAVGYLVEQTTSRQMADKINSQHKYDELLAMNSTSIDNWVLQSGLTKEECAMIQPTYGPTPFSTYNHITPAYGISSSIVGGLNISLCAINTTQIGKYNSKKTVPILGLITGASQVVFGTIILNNKYNNRGTAYSNESEKALSMVNIGIGTTTMILSAWNLITKRKPKEKLTTWNIYTFPTQNNNAGMAFSLTRKF